MGRESNFPIWKYPKAELPHGVSSSERGSGRNPSDRPAPTVAERRSRRGKARQEEPKGKGSWSRIPMDRATSLVGKMKTFARDVERVGVFENAGPPASSGKAGRVAPVTGEEAMVRNKGRDPITDRLILVRVKGYPAWPCEEIPRRSVKKALPEVLARRPMPANQRLVQYFGTLEYGFAKDAQVVPFSECDEETLRTKRKKDPAFQLAVTQMFDMARNPKAKPVGWWNGPKPPPPADSDASDDDDDEGSPKLEKEPRNAPNRGVFSRTRAAWPSKDTLWLPDPRLPDGQFILPEMLSIRCKPRYKTIKRNLYEGPENGSQHKPKRLPREDILVCGCAPGSGCGSSDPEEQETCMNRKMFVRCCSSDCPNGKKCNNKEFSQMKTPKLKAFLTESCGWGVRTKEKIKRGQFVVEYVGEIIDDAECERRMWEAKKVHERNFYMMEISGNYVIDARHKANISRLINSSCQPNCRSQKCVDAATGEVRVGIFAMRDIEAGEELSYNYQFQHFAHGEAAKTSFDCRCGAPNCIGTLDSTVKKRDEVKETVGKKIKVKWIDGKEHLATVTDYDWKAGKYQITYEDGRTEDLSLDPEGKVKFKFLGGKKRSRTMKRPSGEGEGKGEAAKAPGEPQPKQKKPKRVQNKKEEKELAKQQASSQAAPKPKRQRKPVVARRPKAKKDPVVKPEPGFSGWVHDAIAKQFRKQQAISRSIEESEEGKGRPAVAVEEDKENAGWFANYRAEQIKRI